MKNKFFENRDSILYFAVCMNLLLIGFVYNTYGCCNNPPPICPPCQSPGCYGCNPCGGTCCPGGCFPGGVSCCGSGYCWPGQHCSNGCCVPSGATGCGIDCGYCYSGTNCCTDSSGFFGGCADPCQCQECKEGYPQSKCNSNQCCVKGECKDPICDNCHTVDEEMSECGHWANDPNGNACFTTECIQNILHTATCDYKGPDWPCKKSNCNTTLVLDPDLHSVHQLVHDSPCPGGTVNWILWNQFYEGCISCYEQVPTRKACQTACCEFNPISEIWRGELYQCGSCPPQCPP